MNFEKRLAETTAQGSGTQNASVQDIATDVLSPHTPSAKEWSKMLAPFNQAGNGRGVVELAITFIPFCLLWAASAAALVNGQLWGLLLVIPTALFLLRLFLIQHDCGHGSFFSSTTANDWVGRCLGVLTYTPYSFWKHTHNLHHAGSGNLDHRGFGDIKTLTVAEFKAAGTWQKLKYRLYRNPLVMFGIGPSYTFLLDQRLPFGQMTRGWKHWISTLGTNVMIIAVSAALISLVGWKVFLMIQLPIVIIGGTVGIWLFFVQHQFEDMSWDHTPEWNRHEAALHGSTHFDLPQPFRWFTANIGLHHIHHLSARIPFYRLGTVMRTYPSLRNVNRLTFWQSFKCVPLALWDEDNRSMLSFKAAGF